MKAKCIVCKTCGWAALACLLMFGLLFALCPDPGFQLRLAVNAGDFARVSEILSAHPEVVSSRETAYLGDAATESVNAPRSILWKASLLDRGTGRNCGFGLREANGATALHQVAYDGRNEIAAMLLSKGADLEITDRVGWTPLFSASGQPELARILLTAGAKVNIRDHRGETPLHVAARISPWHNEREVVSTLLTHGADPNAVDPKSGYTPLHWAAVCGNEQVCRLLLDKGADPWIKDNWGRTPITIATKIGDRMGKTNLIELFRRLETERRAPAK